MAQEKDKVQVEGAYADGDLVQIPLANLELGSNYRSQLRDMDSLVRSVYHLGVLAPLWVEPHPTAPNKYVVFAGRRRYEAACLAAQRRARESSSKESQAVQIGRYTVPCRIFRNLRQTEAACFALTENLLRSDPSARDTATEMARLKRLLEEERGKNVSVDLIVSFFEEPGRHNGKCMRRKHAYRLLRIGAMNQRVLEVAKSHGIAMDYLEAVARLPSVEAQIRVVDAIHREGLTRQQVRLLVNRVLSLKDAQPDLTQLLAEVRAESARPSGEEASRPTDDRTDAICRAETGADASTHPHDRVYAPTVDAPRGRPSGPANGTDSERNRRPLGKGNVQGHEGSTLEPGTSSGQREPVTPRVEADTSAERTPGSPGATVKENWLKYVALRSGPAEASRIREALGDREYSPFELNVMWGIHMYKNVTAEQLPGYLSVVKETMDARPRFRRLVACSLEMIGLLARRQEYQNMDPIPSYFLNIMLNEVYRAIGKDVRSLDLLNQVDANKKEQFKRTVGAKG